MSGETARAFDTGAMILITIVGVLAFVAMLVLGAYAPDLRSGDNGGAHALSRSAIGLSGLVRLAEATGRHPIIVRNERQLGGEELVVISPDDGFINLGKALDRRHNRATLLILPKWDTQTDGQHSGWVRVHGLLPASNPGSILAPGYPVKVTRRKTANEALRAVGIASNSDIDFAAPPVLQTIVAQGLEPVIVDQHDRVVLGKTPDSQTYLLADADLLDNRGMANPRQAAAALKLLDELNTTGSTSVLFDVTVNGLGHSPSPLQLAFDPPFLGATLAIFVAMLLAGWQALVRFGTPAQPDRAIAFGKAALVENSAALIRRGRREARIGRRYADVVRDRAALLFRLPPALEPEAVEGRLDQLGTGRKFTDLAQGVTDARTRADLLGSARALHQWFQEVRQ